MKKSFNSRILILAIIVGLVISITSYGQNRNSKEILLNAKGDSHLVSNYQTDNTQLVYYDQTTGTVAGTGPASQDFEASFDTYDNQAADNFTIPASTTWTINQVVIGGSYFNGVGPALSFNVFFYSDASGIPGTQVYSATAQPYVYDGTTYFTISLSPAAVLTTGNYWISVQCRMDFAVGGQFAWNVVSGAYGSVAQWQNPGGGFAVCPTWGPITTCNTTVQTDLSFSLNNVVVVGPGPATNPSPANGATGVSAPNVTLSWTNPAAATTNSVYFGTTPGSLTQIHTGSLISSIARTGLSYSTQYYWRVDESNGVNTTTGTEWTFTTGCGTSPAPWTEDFESGVFPPSCWTVTGTSGLWMSGAASGYAIGIYSAKANFYSTSSGTADLISLEYNASGLTNPVLKFDWAYATYAGEVDQMDVYYSTNGGTSWTLLLAMPGGTNGILNPFHIVQTAVYTPTAGQWSTQSLKSSLRNK